MILVHGCFQRNFLGVCDSIMKFLFVLGWDRLLEARFQAWLECSIEFPAPWLAAERPTHHLCYIPFKKARTGFCQNLGWDATQKYCNYV